MDLGNLNLGFNLDLEAIAKAVKEAEEAAAAQQIAASAPVTRPAATTTARPTTTEDLNRASSIAASTNRPAPTPAPTPAPAPAGIAALPVTRPSQNVSIPTQTAAPVSVSSPNTADQWTANKDSIINAVSGGTASPQQIAWYNKWQSLGSPETQAQMWEAQNVTTAPPPVQVTAQDTAQAQAQTGIASLTPAAEDKPLTFDYIDNRTRGDAKNLYVGNESKQLGVDGLREEFEASDNDELRAAFGTFDNYLNYMTERQSLINSGSYTPDWFDIGEDWDDRPAAVKALDNEDLAVRPQDLNKAKGLSDEAQLKQSKQQQAYNQWLMSPENQALMQKYGLDKPMYNQDGDEYKWNGTSWVKTNKVDDHLGIGDYIKMGTGVALSFALGPQMGAALGLGTGAVGTAVGSGLTSLMSQAITTGSIDPKQVLLSAGLSGVGEYLSGTGGLLEGASQAVTDVIGNEIIEAAVRAAGTSTVSQLLTSGDVDAKNVLLSAAIAGGSAYASQLMNQPGEFDFASDEQWDETFEDIDAAEATALANKTNNPLADVPDTLGSPYEDTSGFDQELADTFPAAGDTGDLIDLIDQGYTVGELAEMLDITESQAADMLGIDIVEPVQGGDIPYGSEFDAPSSGIDAPDTLAGPEGGDINYDGKVNADDLQEITVDAQRVEPIDFGTPDDFMGPPVELGGGDYTRAGGTGENAYYTNDADNFGPGGRPQNLYNNKGDIIATLEPDGNYWGPDIEYGGRDRMFDVKYNPRVNSGIVDPSQELPEDLFFDENFMGPPSDEQILKGINAVRETGGAHPSLEGATIISPQQLGETLDSYGITTMDQLSQFAQDNNLTIGVIDGGSGFFIGNSTEINSLNPNVTFGSGVVGDFSPDFSSSGSAIFGQIQGSPYFEGGPRDANLTFNQDSSVSTPTDKFSITPEQQIPDEIVTELEIPEIEIPDNQPSGGGGGGSTSQTTPETGGAPSTDATGGQSTSAPTQAGAPDNYTTLSEVGGANNFLTYFPNIAAIVDFYNNNPTFDSDGNPVVETTEAQPTEVTEAQPTEVTETQPTETQPTEVTETEPKVDTGTSTPNDPESTNSTGTTEPTETQPTETQPTETQPTETQPTETQPTETQPTETQPTETQPTETQPTETQPTETQPTETQPTETGGGETEPTETEPTETGDGTVEEGTDTGTDETGTDEESGTDADTGEGETPDATDGDTGDTGTEDAGTDETAGDEEGTDTGEEGEAETGDDKGDEGVDEGEEGEDTGKDTGKGPDDGPGEGPGEGPGSGPGTGGGYTVITSGGGSASVSEPQLAEMQPYELGGPLDSLMRELGIEAAATTDEGIAYADTSDLDLIIDSLLANQDEGSEEANIDDIYAMLGLV
jgi:hypothetical protein